LTGSQGSETLQKDEKRKEPTLIGHGSLTKSESINVYF
jgi:hypothetical protein